MRSPQDMPEDVALGYYRKAAIDWLLDERYECIQQLLGSELPRECELLDEGVRQYLLSAIRFANNELDTTPSCTAAANMIKLAADATPSNAIKRGPRAMVSEVAKHIHSEQDVQRLRKSARVRTILNGCKHSRSTKLSGLACWQDFARRALRYNANDDLPKTHLDLVAWSETFRSAGTWSNYLGAVKTACLMLGHTTEPFRHELVQRATKVLKRMQVKRAPSPPVMTDLLVKLVEMAASENDHASAALYVVSYWFSLRVPSEALPLSIGFVGPPCLPNDKAFHFKDGLACMEFGRRKHKDDPTSMARECVCEHGLRAICPVHVTRKFFEGQAEGSIPFRRHTPKYVNASLRRRVMMLGEANHTLFTSKCFRRGHAQEIQKRGGTVYDILKSGTWTSRTYRDYLDMNAVHNEAARLPAPPPDSSDDDSATENDSENAGALSD